MGLLFILSAIDCVLVLGSVVVVVLLMAPLGRRDSSKGSTLRWRSPWSSLDGDEKRQPIVVRKFLFLNRRRRFGDECVVLGGPVVVYKRINLRSFIGRGIVCWLYYMNVLDLWGWLVEVMMMVMMVVVSLCVVCCCCC